MTDTQHVQDNDPEYLERTAQRLRTMTATQVDLSAADPDEVRSRIEHMAYGGSRQRSQPPADRT